jgi:hypothetical protein
MQDCHVAPRGSVQAALYLLLLFFTLAAGGCTPESPSTLKNQPTGKVGDAEAADSGLAETSRNSGSPTTATPGTAGQPEESRPLQEALRTDSLRALLADCLNTYRKLERYQDNGQLVIQGSSTLTLPMQVAWEKPNRLGLRTGSMQGVWTSATWEAQSLGTLNPFPNQRLVRPLPSKIDLSWVADDAMGGLLQDPMSKPFQLELLLSSDLSENLAGGDSKLSEPEPASFDGIQCRRVVVERSAGSEQLRWVLWIDPVSKLLRKVELPSRFYYPTIPADQLAGVACAMELRGASAEAAIDWSKWSLPTVPQEVRVSRWVIPPPIASTPILGKVIPTMDLKDVNDSVLLDTAEPKKPWNVLVWISDREESRRLVDDLLVVNRVLIEQELAPACNIYLVCGPDESKGLSEKLKSWNCDIPLVVDRLGTISKEFQVPQPPAMILIDRSRRVQVGEYIITPQTIASIPELVSKLRGQQDLANRQLQQDLDNQARFIGALHRVAMDKEQIAKLPEIVEFPFLMHGMRRDWKVELESPLVSAGGVWYPQAALEVQATLPAKQIVMSTLDEDGRLQLVAMDGTKSICASIDPEQADGAKRLWTSVDPWTHRWVAVVPEGLPRFWIASTQTAVGANAVATAYNTQSAESPVCHAWISEQLGDGQALKSKLAVGTSESRLMIIEPSTEQRLDGTFREPPVSFVPGLNSEGRLIEWDVLYPDGSLHKIPNLTRSVGESIPGEALEARLDRLGVRALGGAWLWGKHWPSNAVSDLGQAREVFLGKLTSGETGLFVANHLHQTIAERPLCVRPEQSRLMGTARIADGTLMGLATGPGRILHLFSGDLRMMDQASFSSRIFGATIIGWQGDLKLIVALEKEVSCWSIDIPDPPSRRQSGSPQ